MIVAGVCVNCRRHKSAVETDSAMVRDAQRRRIAPSGCCTVCKKKMDHEMKATQRRLREMKESLRREPPLIYYDEISPNSLIWDAPIIRAEDVYRRRGFDINGDPI